MNAIVTVNFHNDTLFAVERDDGVFVAVKPICETLGLKWHGQLERLKRDPILTEGIRVIRMPSPGGEQEMTCLRLELVNGWLFTIDTARIKDEAIRGKVILYQRECYRALYEHFHGRADTRPTVVSPAYEIDLAHAPLSSKTDYLRLIYRTMGRGAMIHAHRQIPNLPTLPADLDTVVNEQRLQPREVLSHLLAYEVAGRALRDWLVDAFDGVDGAAERIRHWGVRVEDDYFVVATSHDFIRAIFGQTKWQPAWPHLRALPGALPFKSAKYGKGPSSKGTLIPVYWLNPDNLH